jgi:uncharacterized membrane-anchored protein YitT (DUF2179 family)
VIGNSPGGDIPVSAAGCSVTFSVTAAALVCSAVVVVTDSEAVVSTLVVLVLASIFLFAHPENNRLKIIAKIIK